MKSLRILFFGCIFFFALAGCQAEESSTSTDETTEVVRIKMPHSADGFRLETDDPFKTVWNPEHVIQIPMEKTDETDDGLREIACADLETDGMDVLEQEEGEKGTCRIVFHKAPKVTQPLAKVLKGLKLIIDNTPDTKAWVNITDTTDDSTDDAKRSAYSWTSYVGPDPDYDKYSDAPDTMLFYHDIVADNYGLRFVRPADDEGATPNITKAHFSLTPYDHNDPTNDWHGSNAMDKDPNTIDKNYVFGRFFQVTYKDMTELPTGTDKDECRGGYELSENGKLCVKNTSTVFTEDILDEFENKIGEKYYTYTFVKLQGTWTKTVIDDNGFDRTWEKDAIIYLRVKSEKQNMNDN